MTIAAEPSSLQFDKTSLAWTLPWEDDWVTAVAFADNHVSRRATSRETSSCGTCPPTPAAAAPLPGRSLEGHSNGVTRLLASPDGRWLISASNDRTIRIWDLAATPTEKGTVIVNAKKREAAAEAARSRSPSSPAPMVLCRHRFAQLTCTRSGSSAWPSATMAKTLLSGDDGGRVVLWDFDAGKESAELEGQGLGLALALVRPRPRPLSPSACRWSSTRAGTPASSCGTADERASRRTT